MDNGEGDEVKLDIVGDLWEKDDLSLEQKINTIINQIFNEEKLGNTKSEISFYQSEYNNTTIFITEQE